MNEPTRKTWALTDGAIMKVDQAEGIVVAIRSVTGNVDYQGDRIVAGAFAKFIRKVKSGGARWPAQVLNHQVDPLVLVGKVRDMVELMPGDSRLPAKLQAKGLGGLMVTSQYALSTQAGRETFELVKGGFLEESSFMFWPTVVEYIKPADAVEAGHLCDIKEIDPIVECSDVLMGANPQTVNISAKDHQFATSVARQVLAERFGADSAGIRAATALLERPQLRKSEGPAALAELRSIIGELWAMSSGGGTLYVENDDVDGHNERIDKANARQRLHRGLHLLERAKYLVGLSVGCDCGR